MKNDQSQPQLTVERRPPERRGPPVFMGSVCCTCCCCCCCCAHVIGGVGGALGSSIYHASRGGHSERVAVVTYWSVLTGTTALGLMLSVLTRQIGVGLIVLILGLPMIQLLASIVSLGVVAVVPLPDRGAAVKTVGKISLWGFGVGFAGLLLMVGVGMLIMVAVG